MRKRNTKVAEIILIIAVILFIIFTAITYKNLFILSEGMSTSPGVETTTETIGG